MHCNQSVLWLMWESFLYVYICHAHMSRRSTHERHLIIQFRPKIVEENFLRQLTIGQGVSKWASVWVYKKFACMCVYGCLVEWQVVYTRRFFINHFPWQRLENGGRGKGIENDYCHSIGLFSFKTIMIVRLCDTKCCSMKSSNSICKPWQ